MARKMRACKLACPQVTLKESHLDGVIILLVICSVGAVMASELSSKLAIKCRLLVDILGCRKLDFLVDKLS